MRLSPVLFAALSVTATSTLSLAKVAYGQDLMPTRSAMAAPSTDQNGAEFAIAAAAAPEVAPPESADSRLAQDTLDFPAETESPTPDATDDGLEPESPALELEAEPDLELEPALDFEPALELEAEPPEASGEDEPATDEMEDTSTPDEDETPAPAPAEPVTPATPDAASEESDESDARVLISEVDVSGASSDELETEVYRVIRTQPGRTTTRSQLQEDINAIFATGFFSNVRAEPTDTPLGVKVTFLVQPNPTFNAVQIEGNQVLPPEVIEAAFQDQYGEILNLRQLQTGIQSLNEWYQDNGYVLAQVTDAPQISEDGVVTLVVAEGVIEDIQVRFLDDEGQTTDEEGNPIDGRTRDFIITREFQSQSGDVFNQQQVEQDLQRVFGLGIFEDVRLSLSPGDDPRKVDVTVNVLEGQSGSVAAGLGFSTSGRLFGTLSYQEQNLGGNNQKLGAEIQVGDRELLFDINFTDPWIAGDPYGTSYTVNAFNRRSISLIFDGGDEEEEVRLPINEDGDRDRPRIDRLGGGVSFNRPFNNVWSASLGLQYQRVSIRDGDRDLAPVDELGNPLSLSGTGQDDLWTIRAGVVRDLRNNPFQPTSGTLLRVATEQAFPLGAGSAFFNRLRASYSYYMPVNFLSFNDSRGTEVLAFNVQAGTILGDFPPYEAFALGGNSSVRGYDEGDLGSGQSFVQATVEYRFPFVSIVDGALFIDAASDLGTGDDVIGDPAGARGKPGSGIGVGFGVRVQSPLGPIRVDYGFNDEGDSRLHFGIGERF